MKTKAIGKYVVALCLFACSALGQSLTHGPVVGGVVGSSAKVFVRTDVAATVAIRYGTDPNLVTYSTSSSFVTSSTNDFTKTIPISSLTSETKYYLNVTVNGTPALSAPYPSFKTFAFPNRTRNFNFVVMSDFTTVQNLGSHSQTYASALAEGPAFAFIGGDFDHRNPDMLSAKRNMFKDLYGYTTVCPRCYMQEFVVNTLRQMPIIHQWDDHDAGGNNLDRNYLNWGLSQQVFQEYVPTYTLPTVSPGIWQNFRYAQVEGFVLDCRSQRDPELDFDDASKSMLDGVPLGATGQLQWLENALVASTAKWKILFSSVTVNPTTKFPDGWAGYQTEWNALKSFIDSHGIKNVVIVSGDLHLGAIDDGTHGSGTQTAFPEMCVLQPNGLGDCPTTNDPGVWTQGTYQGTCSGYGLVTIQTNPDRLTFQAVDEFGIRHITYTITAQ
jgi:phosphodiesterase/alkaline phosphatase D-like protein